MKALLKMIGTGFGLGLLPVFPGTMGTFLGCLLWWFIKDLAPETYALLLILLFPLGAWIAEENEKILGEKDSPSIVIDEIFAFPVTMFMVPAGFLTLFIGYVLFRIFDIFKPFAIRKLEELPRGYGVMADDYIAAGFACVCMHMLNYVWPYFPDDGTPSFIEETSLTLQAFLQF